MPRTHVARTAVCKTCKKRARIGAKRADCAPCRANYDRQQRYGVSPAEWRRLTRRHGLCANPHCARTAAVVDHDHRTGRVRGALCRSCNLVLGFAQDDPRQLAWLSDYVTAPGRKKGDRGSRRLA